MVPFGVLNNYIIFNLAYRINFDSKLVLISVMVDFPMLTRVFCLLDEINPSGIMVTHF
jgi:hypothetical protein